MILFVITFNNITLSLLIVFTYHFVPNSSLLYCTKFHLSIIKNQLSYIVLLRNLSTYHLTAILIPTHLYSVDRTRYFSI